MNIKFKELRASDFLSLGKVQVNLINQGFVLVEGVNRNPADNARSNGSGKSSIAEAITFALTGSTIRGTKDVVRNLCKEGTCVELDFSVNNHEYTITRFKEHVKFGNQIKIQKDGEDISGKGIRDTEDILSNEFPDLSAELIGGVIILGQGLPQRFTNNSPVERKAILEKLSKSDYMIEDIKERLNKRKVDLQTILRSTEDLILGNEREERLKREDLTKVIKQLEGFNENKLNELKLAYSELSKMCKDLLETSTQKREELTKVYEELTKLSEDILTLTETLNKQKDSEVKEQEEVLRPLWAKKSIGESRIQQLQREIKKAKEIKDICPTCGQKLQGVICIDTTAMERELNELVSSLESIKDQTLKTDEKIKYIELLYLEQKDIKRLKEKQKELQTSKSAKESEWRVLDNNYRFKQMELNKVEVELNSYENKIKELIENKTNAEGHIASLELSIKQQRLDKEALQVRLDIIQKLLTTAQREFRTYLLESIIVYINKRVGYYSKQLFNTEAEFRQDGNQIYIGYDDKQYEACSGGEKQKVDISVQFAIRDMLIDIIGFNSNVLFCDELFDNLDKQGTDALINMIIKDLNTIESVFIITHHSDTMVPYDRKIKIIKDENGVSKLVGE